MGAILYLISDTVLLPALEVFLVLLSLYALFAAGRLRAERKAAGISVPIRGEVSMGKLVGWYGYVTAVLVAIPLTTSGEHKVLLAFLNAAIAAYLCLINVWSRNLLLGAVERASKAEAQG